MTKYDELSEHDRLAKMALIWIGARATRKGVRGSTEIYLAENYVADAVAICWFQHRFWKHWNLPSPRYLTTKTRLYDVLSVFEAKAHRSDFLKTFVRGDAGHNNRIKPIGNLHWCVVLKDVASPDELPDFWGMLEIRGNGLREIKKPIWKPIDPPYLLQVAYNILWK